LIAMDGTPEQGELMDLFYSKPCSARSRPLDRATRLILRRAGKTAGKDPSPKEHFPHVDTSARDHRGHRVTHGGGDVVRADRADDNAWTRRLVLFLRIMAVLSILRAFTTGRR
jgi:hypothetical protein